MGPNAIEKMLINVPVNTQLLEHAGIDKAALQRHTLLLSERIKTHGPTVPAPGSWDKSLKMASTRRRNFEREELVEWAIREFSSSPNTITNPDLQVFWFDHITKLAPMVFKMENPVITSQGRHKASAAASISEDRVVANSHNTRGIPYLTQNRQRFLKRAGIDVDVFEERNKLLFERMRTHGPSAPTADAWERPFDTLEKKTRNRQRCALARWAVETLSDFPNTVREEEMSDFWYDYITAVARTHTNLEELETGRAHQTTTTACLAVDETVQY